MGLVKGALLGQKMFGLDLAEGDARERVCLWDFASADLFVVVPSAGRRNVSWSRVDRLSREEVSNILVEGPPRVVGLKIYSVSVFAFGAVIFCRQLRFGNVANMVFRPRGGPDFFAHWL